jgi:hypothetical protein
MSRNGLGHVNGFMQPCRTVSYVTKDSQLTVDGKVDSQTRAGAGGFARIGTEPPRQSVVCPIELQTAARAPQAAAVNGNRQLFHFFHLSRLALNPERLAMDPLHQLALKFACHGEN